MKHEKLKKRLNDSGIYTSDELKVPEDKFYMDISYYIAFNQIVYTLVLIFALIQPLTTIVGALYFFIQYIIATYNLTLIYPKEFDGKGEIAKNIQSLGYAALIG